MSTDIQFINLTNRYFNQGCLNKTDKLFSVLNSTYPFKKNSKVLFDSWHQKQISNSTEKESNYSIPGYDGHNEKINALNAFLKKHLSEDLHSAFIHGSHASGDEIPYSDFDGLLILKNEVFSNKKRIERTARKISESYSLMMSIDPLQHHGWFILNESDFLNWPAEYFPPVLFEYSKSLLQNPSTLSLKYSENSSTSKANYFRLLSSIERTLIKKPFPDNYYQLKCLLSEFMLIPTFYLQAKNNTGIYKKFSFEKAAADFPKDKWKIMNTISEIRAEWPDVTSSLNVRRAQIVNPSFKRLQIKSSLKLPNTLSSKLTNSFREEMLELISSFKSAPL